MEKNYTMEENYKIILKTPIGDKIGTLAVKFKSGIIEGILSLFGAENELISGETHGNRCKFSGNIMTAIGFVNYTATGEIDEKGDCIGIAATDKGDMPIIGKKIG